MEEKTQAIVKKPPEDLAAVATEPQEEPKAPRLRSTTLHQDAPEKKSLSRQFTGIWRILNTKQVVMVALLIALGLVVGGMIGAGFPGGSRLNARISALESKVSTLETKESNLADEMSNPQITARRRTTGVQPSPEGSAPAVTASQPAPAGSQPGSEESPSTEPSSSSQPSGVPQQ